MSTTPPIEPLMSEPFNGHTPLPWTSDVIKNVDSLEPRREYESIDIMLESDDVTTLIFEGGSPDDVRSMADVQFTLHAVNTYYAREAERAELIRQRDEAVKLLRVSACPSCDGRGWYVRPAMPDGEPEQIQCQFCYERSAALLSPPQPIEHGHEYENQKQALF